MSIRPAEQLNVVPPLAVITRALDDASDFALPLINSGWQVAGLPLITCEAVAFKAARKHYNWQVFTSRWGISHYMGHYMGQGGMVSQGPKIAVVGFRTARLLEKKGLIPSLIAEEGTSHSLAQSLLVASPTPQRVLWPCGNRALQEWTQTLLEKSWDIDLLQVYRTQLNTHLTAEGLSACQKATVIAFTSPSCVEALFQGLKDSGLVLSPLVKMLAIGPSTHSALQQWFGRCDGVATPHTLAGLAQLTLP